MDVLEEFIECYRQLQTHREGTHRHINKNECVSSVLFSALLLQSKYTLQVHNVGHADENGWALLS